MTQQMDHYESKLENLRNELQQADIHQIQGGDTAMQRFWETMRPPVSSVGRPPVCYHSDSDHDDVDSLASRSIASGAA